ncbi:MAG: hypothetical protein KGL14_07625 [Gammaproteobacteria bacterium]|nr:hypothetical protein [Gammaproteobacteria bacterium]
MNHHHRSSASWGVRAAWLAAFLLTTLLFSLGLTCAVPLIAFGAICALRQSRAQALLFTATLWLATEVIGFTLLRFPIGLAAFGWGALVGAALLAATAAASVVARRVPGAAGITVTYLSAFGLYEGLLWGVSRAIGGASGAFTAGILTQVFVLNGVTFAALVLVGALTAGRTVRGPVAAGAQRRTA